MDDLDKYIDDLFRQKLSDVGASVSTSGNDWTQLSKIIQRKNFLRFNPGSFNIFYLAASAVIITTLCAVVVPGIVNNHKSEKQIEKQTNSVVDSLPVIDTIHIEKDTIVIKPEFLNKKCSTTHKCIELSTDEKIGLQGSETDESNTSENTQELDVSKKDSIENTSSTKQEQIVPVVIEQPVRTDTIVQIDTIRIQKKGVQFKRKKTSL